MKKWKIRKYLMRGEEFESIVGPLTHGRVEVVTVEEHLTAMARAESALLKILSLDRDPSLHAKNASECAICVAREYFNPTTREDHDRG